MVTPPQKEGIAPIVLGAAKLAGVDAVYQVGGAQAVGALAYGTESIPKVDKIVGPGNIYVATAKRQVFGQVSIDMIAGPSEIGIWLMKQLIRFTWPLIYCLRRNMINGRGLF